MRGEEFVNIKRFPTFKACLRAMNAQKHIRLGGKY